MEDASLWSLFVVPVILIILRGYVLGAKTAIRAVNESNLRKNMSDDDKKISMLLKILENPDHYFAGVQVTITLTGLLASALIASKIFVVFSVDIIKANEHLNVDLVHTIITVIATLLLVFVMSVFADFLPRKIAMKNPEKTAKNSAFIIAIIAFILIPFVWIITKFTNLFTRMLGMNPHEDQGTVTEDRIRQMIDIGEEKGSIESEEKEYIENIFDFNDVTAEDIMTHRKNMVAINVEESNETILAIIEECGYSRFPVFDEDIDDIVGMLRTREFLLNSVKDEPLPLRDILDEINFVPETVKANTLFRTMQNKNAHMSIVIDEYGGTSGVVTLEDLLEEIFGNIYDESDKEEDMEILELEDGSYRILGITEVEDIAKHLHIEIEESEEYDTLGGLIFSQLSSIPEDGTHPEIDVYGLHIKIEEIVDHRIISANVSKNEEEIIQD